MKFSALVAIVPDDLEQTTIDTARELGAGGITLLHGRGISNSAKKSFFGMTFDGSQSVLLMVLEKGLSLDILKAVQHILVSPDGNSQGIVFTLPLEHLAGIDLNQVNKFEQHVKDNL